MTKYIGKKIIYSTVIILAFGFVLYMLSMTKMPDPNACTIYDITGVVVLREDALHYYKPDSSVSCFTPFYFIPVNAGMVLSNDEIWLPYIEDENNVVKNFVEKYYISPFTNEHIIARYGLSSRVYTLYKTEKAVIL